MSKGNEGLKISADFYVMVHWSGVASKSFSVFPEPSPVFRVCTCEEDWRSVRKENSGLPFVRIFSVVFPDFQVVDSRPAHEVVEPDTVHGCGSALFLAFEKIRSLTMSRLAEILGCCSGLV